MYTKNGKINVQENLLLDRNQNIIITNFGFANTFDVEKEDDAMKERRGTPQYTPPKALPDNNCPC